MKLVPKHLPPPNDTLENGNTNQINGCCAVLKRTVKILLGKNKVEKVKKKNTQKNKNLECCVLLHI